MPTKNLRNRILSILVSLALSFCLWMAISGQDMSTVDISVPLELANLPGDLLIKSEVPASVTFQVRANAAQVRFLADRKPHLWLNISSARPGGNIFPVPTASLDLPRGVQVGKSTPSVIEFEAVRVTSRLVPIRPVVRGHPDPAYNLASVVIEPDLATVQGPRELMEGLEFIATAPINVDGLNEDANLVVLPALADLDPALTVTPGEVRVFVNLEERLAEKTFTDVPIVLKGTSPSLDLSTLSLAPDRVTVAVAWPLSVRLGLEAEALEVAVRVDAIRLAEAGGTMELPVLVSPPPGVKVLSIDPVNVTVKDEGPAIPAPAETRDESDSQ